jgi:hypothetical protein
MTIADLYKGVEGFGINTGGNQSSQDKILHKQGKLDPGQTIV